MNGSTARWSFCRNPLNHLSQAAIRWPTASQMEESVNVLQRNSSCGYLLKGIFAIVDGARMPCADYMITDLQNGYY